MYLSIYPSIYLSIHPGFSLSVPSTAARQLFKDQLFTGSPHNLLVYFSSTCLSSYSTCFSTPAISTPVHVSGLISLSIQTLFVYPVVYPITSNSRESGGPKNRGGIDTHRHLLLCSYPSSLELEGAQRLFPDTRQHGTNPKKPKRNGFVTWGLVSYGCGNSKDR